MASVYEYPNFAVLCSFFERYSQQLQLPDLTIPELQIALEHKLIVVPELREILFKLLRKIVKSINKEKWERKLVQLTREHFDKMAAWEIERCGFVRCRLETKIEVLKFLCESQFDDNVKFKSLISNEEPYNLRVLPIGRDKTGLVYWYQKDQDTNVRVYREEQDDMDSSTWEIVSAQRDELASLIDTLKKGFTHVKTGNTPDDSESTSDSIGAIEKAVKAQTEEKGDSKEEGVDNEEKSESKDENKDKDESSSKASAKGDSKDSSAKEKEGEDKMELPNTDKNGIKDGKCSRVEDEKKSGIEKVVTEDEDRDVGMVGKKEKSGDSDQGENYKESAIVDDLKNDDDNKATKSTSKETNEQLEKLSNETQSKENQQEKKEQQNQNSSETSTKTNNAGVSLVNDRREGKDIDDVKALANSTNTKLAQDKDKSDNPDSSGVKDTMEANSQDKGGNSKDDETSDETTPITKGNKMRKLEADEETEEKEGCKEGREIDSDDCGSRVESVIKYTGEKMREGREGRNEDADIAEEEKVDNAETRKSVGKETTEDVAAEEDGQEHKKIYRKENKEIDAMEIDGKDAERSCGRDTKIKEGGPEFEDVTTDDAKEKGVKEVTHKESKDLKDAERTETQLAKDKKESKNLKDAKRTETQLANDNKESKDLKDAKRTETKSANNKESKDLKDAKRTETESANNKESKDLKDAKRTETESANNKESKDRKDAKRTETESANNKESKDLKDAKRTETESANNKESKDLKDAKRTETESANNKESKDRKDAKRTETESANNKESKDLKDAKRTETESENNKESKDLKDAKRTETESANNKESKDLKDAKRTETESANNKESKDLKDAKRTETESANNKESKDLKDAKRTETELAKDKKDHSTTEAVKKVSKDSCKTDAQIKSEIKKEEIISGDEVVKKSEIKSENKSQAKSMDVLDDSKTKKQQNGIKKEEIKDINKDIIEHIEKCSEEAEDCKKSSVAKPEESKEEDVTDNEKKGVKSKQTLEKQKKRKLNEVESDTSELSRKKIKGKDDNVVKKGNSYSEKEDSADSEEESDKKKSSKKGKTKNTIVTRVMPSRRSTRAKKPVNAVKEDSEEASDDKDKSEKEEQKSKKGKTKAKAGRSRKPLESDEDSEEKSKSKDKKGWSRKHFDSEEDEEDSSEEKSKSKAKKGQSRKRVASDEDESESEKITKVKTRESASEEEKKDSEEDEESEEEQEKESTKTSKGQAKKGGKTKHTPRRIATSIAVAIMKVCEEEEEEEEENDQPCSKCQQYNHPEWILLCDKCDSGYHTACLRPPLMIIPDGNWYCPTCEHAELIVKLEEALTKIDAELYKKQKNQTRKNKSTKWAYTDLCMENILPDEHVMVLKHPPGSSKHKHRHKHRPHSRSPSRSHSKSTSSPRSSRPQRSSRSLRSCHEEDDFIDDGERHRDFEDFEIVSKRSTRQRKQISYKFEDFDEAINSAIYEEIEEHQKAVELTKTTFGISRGKDMSNILGAEADEEEEEEEEVVVEKDNAARKIKRKLTDLDGTTSEEDSDDFKVEESEPDSAEEEPSPDSDASGDSGVVRPRKRSKRTRKWSHLPKRKSKRTRHDGRRQRYDYESDEEESSGAMDESGSDESSAYSDYSGPTARKQPPRRPNYREKSDSETESEVGSTKEYEDSQELIKKPKKDYETSSDEEDDAAEEEKAYSMKRKFVLESDDEEEEVLEKKETRTIVKKPTKEKKKRKRDEVAGELSLGHEMKPTRSKRVDYKKMALGDGESISEAEEQEYGDEDKSASKQNHKSKDASPVDTKESISEKSNKAKLVDSDRTLKGGASDPVNGSDTLFNGDDDDEEGDISAAPSEVAEGDVEDEDLLNIADLVDFVTQDS